VSRTGLMDKWTTRRAAAAALRVAHLSTAPTATTMSRTALCASGWVHFRLSSGLVFDDHCAALDAPSGSVFDYQVGLFCPEKQNRRSRPLSGAGQHETNTAAQAVVIKPVIGPEQ